MTGDPYRLAGVGHRDDPRESRDVVDRTEQGTGYWYWCPCGQQLHRIDDPPHTITFDADNVMNVQPSIVYAANEAHPQNWCHYYIENGVPRMCKDAQCPGAELRE